MLWHLNMLLKESVALGNQHIDMVLLHEEQPQKAYPTGGCILVLQNDGCALLCLGTVFSK